MLCGLLFYAVEDPVDLEIESEICHSREGGNLALDRFENQ
jgi:hypothetical protein